MPFRYSCAVHGPMSPTRSSRCFCGRPLVEDEKPWYCRNCGWIDVEGLNEREEKQADWTYQRVCECRTVRGDVGGGEIMFQCSCPYDDYADENYYDIVEFQHVATKDLKCCECGETIPIGATYEYTEGLDEDGEVIGTHITCLICSKIAKDACPDYRLYGGLAGILEECGMSLFTDPAEWPNWD